MILLWAAMRNIGKWGCEMENSKESERIPVRKSSEWSVHFERNARCLRPIPWSLGAGVTDAELASIAGSLRAWQLGETSDGSHLLAASHNYATSIGDPEFVAAVRLFIAEEQRHGRDLGRFLELAGVIRAESDWGDYLFRTIRYAWPRMEIWATPVVMVETHALIYYNAIRRATCRRCCGRSAGKSWRTKYPTSGSSASDSPSCSEIVPARSGL